MAGDVCTGMGAGPPAAVEFAAGSITSASVGESNFRMPGGQLDPRQRRRSPRTPPEILAHYRGLNPWFEQLDLDRHGYGIAIASQTAFDVTLKRLWTVKERNFGHAARRPASAGRSSAARRRSRAPPSRRA